MYCNQHGNRVDLHSQRCCRIWHRENMENGIFIHYIDTCWFLITDIFMQLLLELETERERGTNGIEWALLVHFVQPLNSVIKPVSSNHLPRETDIQIHCTLFTDAVCPETLHTLDHLIAMSIQFMSIQCNNRPSIQSTKSILTISNSHQLIENVQSKYWTNIWPIDFKISTAEILSNIIRLFRIASKTNGKFNIVDSLLLDSLI